MPVRTRTGARTFPNGYYEARGESRSTPLGGGLTLPTIASTITSDSFTGGDIANLEGRNTDVALGGSAKTWLSLNAGSGVGIVSGRMARTSGASQQRLGFDAGSGDILVRCKVYENAGVFGAPIIQIRRADIATTATDHYKIEINTAGILLLRKNSGGTNTTLYTFPTAVTGGTQIGIFAKGTTVGLMVAGRVVYTTIDSSVASSRTFFAIQVQTQAVLVDDLIVSQL